MDIKQIIVIVRGTAGEAKKAVYDGSGACIAGDEAVGAAAIATLAPGSADPPKAAAKVGTKKRR